MKNLIIIALAFSFLTACSGSPAPNANSNRPALSGVEKTEDIPLRDFTGLRVANNIALEIAVGPDFSIKADGDGSLVEILDTSLDEGVLVMGLRQKFARGTRVNIKVTMPVLTELELSGGSTAIVTAAKGEKLKLTTNGAARIKVDGEVKNFEAVLNGASSIEAETLKAANVAVRSQGASGIIVSPSVSLNAVTSGMSKVQYTGSPKVEKTVSDTSVVVKKQ